jgi:hypothetical protein
MIAERAADGTWRAAEKADIEHEDATEEASGDSSPATPLSYTGHYIGPNERTAGIASASPALLSGGGACVILRLCLKDPADQRPRLRLTSFHGAG